MMSEESTNDEKEIEIQYQLEDQQIEPKRQKFEVDNNPKMSEPDSTDKKNQEWDDERTHFQKIVTTFNTYKKFSKFKIKKSLDYLLTLPERHQVLLDDYKSHLLNIESRIEFNQNLFSLFVYDESHLFENHDEVFPMNGENFHVLPKPSDYDKLSAVLKQIVRDWSVEGKNERDSCYVPILNELESQFPPSKRKDARVLVPGAGMGRLTHEIVRRGFITEGNEFSLFMLFASNFILNKCYEVDKYKCYPWIHQTSNILRCADQIRPVTFPDIDPSDLPEERKFSMTAGDFLEVYGTKGNQGAWDCIVTCFFIDCASNIVAFLERIYDCLKPNGVWINLGPLLYHYADMQDENSIEPSFDILLPIIEKIGFIIEKHRTDILTRYADNQKSMLDYSYKSIIWVAIKPPS